jgi:tetratricopeptide (TPR) repeat protein
LAVPPWLDTAWKFLLDPDNQKAIGWLGGGIATVAAAIWAVIKFFADRKKDDDKSPGATKVTQSGQGAVSGRDTTYQGPVTFGPSKEQIEQIQKPLAEQLAAQNALIKTLLEKNPSTAPGVQQAVGAAVASIAQGAEEGDSLLEEALGLLRQNKPGEAVPLLEAFAKDKESKIAKDRKEAAVAYRNLGTIAGLADPKRALEAYEKALALDPDDLQSLLWIGWIQINYGDLNKAQSRLERLLKHAEPGDQPFFETWALTGLGRIKQQRGDLSGALKSYSDSLATIERLANSDPGNAEWQRDLSVSYDRVGDVQKAQGDLSGALKSYSDSLAIIERLTNSDPGNAEWQRDLSVSFAKLANTHKQLGDKARASDYLRQGQAIMVRLTKLSPDNAQWKSDLAWIDGQIADLDPENAEVRS